MPALLTSLLASHDTSLELEELGKFQTVVLSMKDDQGGSPA